MCYLDSHFAPALDLIMLTVGIYQTRPPINFQYVFFMTVPIIVSFLCVPFLFNYGAVHLPTLWRDFWSWSEFNALAGLQSDSTTSYVTWWERKTPKAAEYTLESTLYQFFIGTVHLSFSYQILLGSNFVYSQFAGPQAVIGYESWLQLSLSFVPIIGPAMTMALIDTFGTHLPSVNKARPFILGVLLLIGVGYVTCCAAFPILTERYPNYVIDVLFAVVTHTTVILFFMFSLCSFLTLVQVRFARRTQGSTRGPHRRLLPVPLTVLWCRPLTVAGLHSMEGRCI